MSHDTPRTPPSELSTPDYLRNLAERLRDVPGTYNIDGYDIDRLESIAGDLWTPGFPTETPVRFTPDEEFDKVQELAREYADICSQEKRTDEDRARRMAIVESVHGLHSTLAIFFAQQVASRIDQRFAVPELCVLTNRFHQYEYRVTHGKPNT